MNWNNSLNTPELADIVGRLNGDGHLQLMYNKKGKIKFGSTSFYSKDIKEINDMIKKFKKLFNATYHLYPDNRKNKRYKLFFLNTKLALFLNKEGVVTGSKSNNAHLIPKWIINGNKEIKSSFLRGLFDTEGSIFLEKYNNRWRISISQHKIESEKENAFEYFNQIKKMLSEFSIKSSPVRSSPSQTIKRLNGTKTIEAKISIEKSSFRNFYENIGFNNIYKRKNLITSLKGAWPR